MSYGYYSDIYRLPTMVRGDSLSEREEKRKSRIIDNQLYISLWLHGTGNGVIKEGQYLGTFSSGNSSVRLIENKPSPALECLISQIYGYTTDQLTWTGLANNTTYYLYATIVENATDTNPTGDSTREYKDIATTQNTTGITPANSILIATATTTASAISIDTNPSGKRYIKSVEDNTDFVSGIDSYENSVFRKAVEIRGGLTSGIDIYGDVVITGTGNTFTVYSPTTFNDPVTFNDYIIGNPLTVRSGEDIYGNETVRGNLEVQGQIASGIDVFGGDSIIRDDIVLQRTLDVLHDTYLETLTVRSGENIYGDAIFHDNVTIQNDLKVLGHTSASGLTIFGNLYITGGGIKTTHSTLTDMPSSINTDHDGRYYKAGDNPNLSGLSIFGDLHVTGGFPVGPDEKVKVTANDTTPNYLTGKIIAGTNITLTENNDGGNETLTIAATDTTNAPGGNDREVQFNNATAFGGAAGLRYASSSLVIVNSGIDVTTTSTFRNSVGIQDSLSVEDSSTLKDVTVTALGSLTVNGPTTLTGLTVRSGADVYGDSTFREDVVIQRTVAIGNDYSDVTWNSQLQVKDEIDATILIHTLNSLGYAEIGFKTPSMTDPQVPFVYAWDGDKSLRLYAFGKDEVILEDEKVRIQDRLLLHSGIDVYNAGLFRSGVEIQENLSVEKKLEVEGQSSLSGLSVFGNIHVTGSYPSSGGVTAHSALTGLGNDDHTQYSRTDGTRLITGLQTFGSGVDVYSTSTLRDDATLQKDLGVIGYSSQSGITIFGDLRVKQDIVTNNGNVYINQTTPGLKVLSNGRIEIGNTNFTGTQLEVSDRNGANIARLQGSQGMMILSGDGSRNTVVSKSQDNLNFQNFAIYTKDTGTQGLIVETDGDLLTDGKALVSGLTVFGNLNVTGDYPGSSSNHPRLHSISNTLDHSGTLPDSWLDQIVTANKVSDASLSGINWTELTDGGSTTLHTHAGGSGDITSVGDVADGAAFDGTQGTTLTFYNAGGNATVAYDGTTFILSSGLDVYSTSVLRDDLTLQGDILFGADSRFDFGTNTVRGRVSYFDRLNVNDGTLADSATTLINGKINLSGASAPTGINLDVDYSGATTSKDADGIIVLCDNTSTNGTVTGINTSVSSTANNATVFGGLFTAKNDSSTGTTVYGVRGSIRAGDISVTAIGGEFTTALSGATNRYGVKATGATADVWLVNRTLKAGATYTFPAADGSANQCWVTNASGVLSWVSPYYSGGTDVTVADGGTGASTAADARTNLGIATVKGARVSVGTINKAATASGTVTFATAFSSTPNVSVDVEHSTVNSWSITVNTISTTAFSWQIYNGTGAQQTNVFMQWTANNGGDP